LAFSLAATWRNPVLVLGDYYLAHTTRSVPAGPDDAGPGPPAPWALDGTSGGTGRAKLISPLGSVKRRDDVGFDLAQHYRDCAGATAAMAAGIEPLADSGYTEDADVVVVAFGTPGRYVRAAVRQLRDAGQRVGWVRPITIFPFPSETVAMAAAGARMVLVYENNQGQMVDDVRLAVLGRTPVEFIGGLSLDSSGFGIAPDLDVATLADKIVDAMAGLPHRATGAVAGGS